jgi:LysM repeat protein
MWNSSRRIALFSTSLVLLGAGLFGAAWLAHWLPIEVGEAETGDLATQQTLEELEGLDWSSFSDRGGLVSSSDPGAIVHSQNEPDPASAARDSFRVNPIDITDREGWRDQVPESNADRLSTRTGEVPASTRIPDEFPNSDFSNTRQVSGSRAASYGASADGRSVRTIPTDVAGSTPRRLFDTEESPTFGEARGFPTEVAFADRAAELDLFAPEESETSDDAPPFDAGADARADDSAQPGDTPVRTAARTESAETAASPADNESTESKLLKIDEWLANRNYVAAHRELSTLYWNNPELKSLIHERIEKNAKMIYFTPGSHFLEPYVIQSGDFLQRVAPKYGINWEYLAALNKVDPRRVRVGQKLKVIKGPFSAFVDLGDFELTVHCHGFFVKRYQIGIGRDSSTPVGKFAVLDRIQAPQYTDPDGRVTEGGDPTNPLGTHWIDLGDSYGIHGTIEPESIGKAESAGCVRMRNEDVVEVYNFLVKGSEVVIRP